MAERCFDYKIQLCVAQGIASKQGNSKKNPDEFCENEVPEAVKTFHPQTTLK